MADAIRSAVLYVFSGTGNTLTAAEAVAANLRAQNVSTTVHRVKKDMSGSFGDMPDPNEFDIAGFAYPIHAFNSPQFFLRFVKTLPELTAQKKGMRAFILKTSGEPFRPNHASSFSLCRILKKKGFVPFYEMHMLMPYNIMFRYPDAMAKQMYLHTTQVMAPKAASELLTGRYKKSHFNPLTVAFSYLLRLQWFGAWINGPLHKVDRTRCTGCGACAANCPSRNIKMVAQEGTQTSCGSSSSANDTRFPSFGIHCTMCMGCTMSCPKNAIKPGFLTPWKVYPAWNFKRLLEDESIPNNWTDNKKAGYFKLFRKYYNRNQ